MLMIMVEVKSKLVTLSLNIFLNLFVHEYLLTCVYMCHMYAWFPKEGDLLELGL